MHVRKATAAVIVIAIASTVCAQDREWLATWEAAQRQQPRSIAAVGRIAAVDEPGVPLVVHGRVLQKDGRSPAPNVIVFAYQTDHTGVYNHRGNAGWRLRGWARSDSKGHFEFRTIRPRSYPQGRVPAHIHLTIEGPGVPRRWTEELRFLDDPYVTAQEKQRSAAAGVFGNVRPVTTRAGVQHVDYNIRITDEGRF